jgi:hypothetical protein
VVPALAALAAAHPGVRPTVLELDEEPATAALHAGELDLVLVEDDAQHPRRPAPGLAHRWLLHDPFRLALPAGWPVPDALADLADRAWVHGPPGSAVRRVLDRLRATSGLALPGVHSCLEFPAALSLVDAGLAAALVPDLALTDAVPAGVRVVDLPGLGARSIAALYRAGPHPPAAPVRHLVEALTEAAGQPPR